MLNKKQKEYALNAYNNAIAGKNRVPNGFHETLAHTLKVSVSEVTAFLANNRYLSKQKLFKEVAKKALGQFQVTIKGQLRAEDIAFINNKFPQLIVTARN